MERMPHKGYLVLKRGMDFGLAVILVVILSPVMLLIAVLIKLDSRGPVVFRQKRTGYRGEVFEIWKFRSMAVGNDYCGAADDRYTRVGRLLRKASLDELPQLFNILVGKMSFVGPRPWVVEYYENMNARERQRVLVRPGLTGLAQAKGRNGLTVFEKIEYDLEYGEKCSCWLDLRIVLMTGRMVFMPKWAEAGKAGVNNEIECLRRRRGV